MFAPSDDPKTTAQLTSLLALRKMQEEPRGCTCGLAEGDDNAASVLQCPKHGKPRTQEPLPAEEPWRWRVGRKLGRTIYYGDILHGMVDTPAIAQRIVGAMNAPQRVNEACNVPQGQTHPTCKDCFEAGRKEERRSWVYPSITAHGETVRVRNSGDASGLQRMLDKARDEGIEFGSASPCGHEHSPDNPRKTVDAEDVDDVLDALAASIADDEIDYADVTSHEAAREAAIELLREVRIGLAIDDASGKLRREPVLAVVPTCGSESTHVR